MDVYIWLCFGLLVGLVSGDDFSNRFCLSLPDRRTCAVGLRITRFYYDASAQQCKEFAFGGCPSASMNNYLSRAACEAACAGVEAAAPPGGGGFKLNSFGAGPFRAAPSGKSQPAPPPRVPEICRLQPERGQCRASIPRFYYHPSSQGCRRFTFGGCRGNANNFFSLAECAAACRELPPPPTEPAAGSGAQGLSEVEKGTSHGGSDVQDTGSDFQESGSDVQETGSDVQETGGDVQEAGSDVQETGSDVQETGSDVQETGSEDNGGVRVEDPVAAVCSLPVDPGNCRASLPRWFFDSATSRCAEFVYGGCGGNSNNFNSLRACRQSCRGEGPRSSVEFVPCDASPETRDRFCQQCDPEDLCTCDGETSALACLSRRGPVGGLPGGSTESTGGSTGSTGGSTGSTGGSPGSTGASAGSTEGSCDEPVAETGPCRASIPRWTWNAASGRCEMFTYGGCQGNGNNFESVELCRQECASEDKNVPGSGGAVSLDAAGSVNELPLQTAKAEEWEWVRCNSSQEEKDRFCRLYCTSEQYCTCDGETSAMGCFFPREPASWENNLWPGSDYTSAYTSSIPYPIHPYNSIAGQKVLRAHNDVSISYEWLPWLRGTDGSQSPRPAP